ncbi:adenylate/guanylate cyclase domain-containing protein [Nitratireductor mangrovi]|uniref:Adenylate/guanylate cyclase domain-containing protein n=1 Tax=Nitratireductor mangrovi TaxID=2599600 RepID=A0A5B8KTQ7_9HYPH|nr:adenylate/guanylate cyclase domain-containing protein [Nitratireductor mangrovi]QDY98994.1 adenylate/guanylate cyclase domain-containing protein [Nitratireductor mangrovi]
MPSRQFQRQVATIVSIDAAGFSRLMGMDDEAAVSSFEKHRDLIRESCTTFGGRLFGPAGDSMMAEFGAPVEALLAVIDFQSRIRDVNASVEESRRMAFRAGINTGHVIVRDESRYGDDVNIAARLQEIAPEGGVVISETTWHHVRGRMAAHFTDLGIREFHNILLPVRAFRVDRADGATAQHAEPRDVPVSAFSFFRADGKGGPPAVAVLPFRIEAGDPEISYMAEGMAEDIIVGLSNTRWLPVISMNSSLQFRDEAISPDAAGRALGARYVVTGTIARSGSRLRVRAALDDASTNRNIWSRRFDRDFSDMFAMQGEIGNEIVAMLEKEVDRVEQARTFRVPWEGLESWQLVRRGRWHMQRRTRENTELALEFFEKAYERDPNASTVLNELAWWYFWRSWLNFGGSGEYKEDLARVEEFSRTALYMDSQDARPYAHLGIVDIMLGRPASAREHLAEAIGINPSFAFARSAMGSAHLLLGDEKRAIPLFLDADRLSPFDLYRFHNLGELASAYCFAQDWPSAVVTAERSLSLAPSYWYARFLKIAALGAQGDHAAAKAERAVLAARDPQFATRRVEFIPFADSGQNRFLIDLFDRALEGVG